MTDLTVLQLYFFQRSRVCEFLECCGGFVHAVFTIHHWASSAGKVMSKWLSMHTITNPGLPFDVKGKLITAHTSNLNNNCIFFIHNQRQIVASSPVCTTFLLYAEEAQHWSVISEVHNVIWAMLWSRRTLESAAWTSVDWACSPEGSLGSMWWSHSFWMTEVFQSGCLWPS